MAGRCKNYDPCEVKPKFVKKQLPAKCESKFLDIVRQACLLYDDYVDLATAVKQNLDELYGPTWHVVVGPTFASHIIHEKKAFAHIKCNNLSFLIFRYG
ncbi:unnamed protein product [Dibothriocephalus latus]|uniref:Dynein light chain n=1 Tax=Dibothriocephalus latus TaxID=60516 RepID=A0A3P6S6B3_DIBLA|nr:unnamed protein product [Dibothriocephalus latus]